MKKTLLLAVLAAGATMGLNAQTLAFQYEGENLENGASIVYKGYSEETLGLEGFIRIECNPEIHIVSTTDALVTVNVKSNLEVGLCAGGDCIKGTDLTKNQVSLTANKPLDLQFDYLYNDYEYDGGSIDIPAIDAVITAWYNEDPNNVIVLNVRMGGFAGVDSVISGTDAIKVAGRNLNYDLAKESTISLYSLSGKTLMNKTVAGTGSINLGNLPAGVYVYRVNGGTPKAGKFVIK